MVTPAGKSTVWALRRALPVAALFLLVMSFSHLAAPVGRAQDGERIQVPLKAGTVTFRQVEGLLYGVGDVECGGFGVIINLPAGTVLCFSETGIATLDLRNPADDELVATILADSPAFRLVPLPSPSQTAPPRPPGTGSGVQAASEPNVAPVVLVVAGIATLLAGAAAVAMSTWRRE
jgi:hypothetical protein